MLLVARNCRSVREPARPETGSWLGGMGGSRAEFRFTDHWRVESCVDEVADLFLDTPSLSLWWPQLGSVTVDRAGGDCGEQRAFRARAQGFLPYALNLEFRVVEVAYPRRFAVVLNGDLVGEGGGRLWQTGRHVAIELELHIRLARPLLNILSYVARPALVAQHRWVMECGQRGLQAALARRQDLRAAVLI